MQFLTRCLRIVLFLLIAALTQLPARAIIIQIDYTFDTGNFFSSGSAQRARLEDATGFFENLLIDDLDAITPTANYTPPFFMADSWEVNFTNPSTGVNQTVRDLVVPADTIILYVGARTFSGAQLAEAGYGGSTTFAGASFNNTVATRGESGVGTTDFAPWGGFLSIDDDTTWDTSVSGNGTDQHLYSTLLHEVSHVLGLGTAASWDSQVSGGQFTGTESVAEHGGNVPLYYTNPPGRYDHWADGTTSNVWGTGTSHEAAMDPSITAGDVKWFTYLDVAALDDIGWDIATIPEPSNGVLLGIGFLLFLRRRRR
jgi:hypothetical protein